MGSQKSGAQHCRRDCGCHQHHCSPGFLSSFKKSDFILKHGSVGKECACKVGDTGKVSSVLGGEDTLAKGMAAHSSVLAWKIPWSEEPGGLQSLGSQRVGYD